eukprot:TRINITY_DN5559_c0_g1_i1.p2 TRINITY_DN5559_c0_g1~~TRINITY_DN5559_c0_g1_i1.p2  ORF type:complete len:79 (-),score=11.50 TRINITY_DN5559_c0_g1_i1:89-325(-)
MEPEEGGGTFFPRSSRGPEFKVTPKKGSAALFYSMLPDGNLDVNSKHGGLPVTKGEKYNTTKSSGYGETPCGLLDFGG